MGKLRAFVWGKHFQCFFLIKNYKSYSYYTWYMHEYSQWLILLLSLDNFILRLENNAICLPISIMYIFLGYFFILIHSFNFNNFWKTIQKHKRTSNLLILADYFQRTSSILWIICVVCNVIFIKIRSYWISVNYTLSCTYISIT